MSVAAERETGPLSGREAAYRAVLSAARDGTFAHDSLASMRSAGRLDSREAGLAMEIALGTLRHWLTLAKVVAASAKIERRRMTPPHQALVYSAAYQIIWMDRVPVFAAVDEAVELARRVLSAKAAPFVNAVLRNVGRAIASRREPWESGRSDLVRVSWDQACAFNSPVLPDPAAAGRERYLAAAAGERVDRVLALFERFGDAAAAVIWACQAAPPVVLQRNPIRAEGEAFAAAVRERFGDRAASDANTAWLASAEGLADWPVFAGGGAYVQDPTAHAAAGMVDAAAGERVLDLCAAPGGKSITMAIAMGDHGEIVACDVDAARVEQIRENARRLGLSSIHACAIGGDRSWPAEARGQYDAAIVDVPCSNTGVFARRPEARLRFDPDKLRPLIERQESLLRRAAQHVRPGGRLVYSTCSIETRENERVVERFLKAHREWALEGSNLTLPHWGRRPSEWRDGGFAARLVRGA